VSLATYSLAYDLFIANLISFSRIFYCSKSETGMLREIKESATLFAAARTEYGG